MFEEFQEEKIRLFRWKVGPSRFTAAPESGARLMSWDITSSGAIRQIIYWPAHANLADIAKVRGGNPILFPFSARSFDKGIENTWRDPLGERRPMPRHGFAREGSFSITSIGDSGFTAQLQPTPKDFEAYPFNYSFFVAYKFEELSLKCTFSLKNEGDSPLPWSAGHHFYFKLPWHNNLKRQDYRLCMEPKKAAFVRPDGKLAMEKNPIECCDLGDPSLVDRIHWQLRHSRISFGPKSGEEDVHLILDKNPVPPKNLALVTWTESPDSPFYCIEPWMGPPNAAEHGKGLHWVNPGETTHFEIEVSLY